LFPEKLILKSDLDFKIVIKNFMVLICCWY